LTKSLDFLIKESGDTKELGIAFFGGEPLLNFDTLQFAVEYCRQQEQNCRKRFHFTITTNGILLTKEVAKYLKRNDIAIMVSIDGPREVHDAMRCFPNGSGSYDLIATNLKQIRSLGITLSARATITSQCLDLVSIIRHLEKMGFSSVRYGLAKKQSRFKRSELERLEKELEKLVLIYFQKLEKKEKIVHLPLPFHYFFTRLRRERYSVFPCGAGRSTITVSIDGAIYACHRMVGAEDFKIGDIYQGIDVTKVVAFFDALSQAMRKCKTCWARYICDEKCYYDLADPGGGFIAPSETACDSRKRLIELSIAYYLEMRDRFPEMFRELDRLSPTSASITELAVGEQQG